MRVNPDRPREKDLRLALAVLKNGGVITLPTDTVYGLAVDPFNPQAVERLYRIKGRDEGKPVACLLANAAGARGLVKKVTADYRQLARQHWPGALTLVALRGEKAPEALTRGLPGLGLRVPSSAWARELAEGMGGAIAATSANLSGKAPALDGETANQAFGGRVQLLIDGGPCPGGAASAVVDCTRARMKILRQGSIFENRPLNK